MNEILLVIYKKNGFLFEAVYFDIWNLRLIEKYYLTGGNGTGKTIIDQLVEYLILKRGYCFIIFFEYIDSVTINIILEKVLSFYL